ncbi:uncharacterized protein [Drosophila virilis]|uniref:Uncharacterized protein, isoform B n=1 Tax=Drosophila virilis TaxID=7244 RepID=A0A0Q9WK98_DROVI|nr:uncharacterized protein LOC26531301 isoform X2 [Drosophila virilis]KRF82439.1 uncharacterized protein Dvir_GJ26531, isoform B [Drosophila virilis]
MFNVNTVIQTQGLSTNSSTSTAFEEHSLERHSQFHEQKLIEKFCRATQLVKLIEGTVENFLRNYRRTRKPEEALAPLRLRLDFNYVELVEHAPQLLHLVVEEPLQFAEAVKYSVYGQVRDLLKANANDNGIKAIDIAQLHTHWRLVDLPLQQNLLYNPTQYLYRLGLALVNGFLSAYTPPETLVLQSIWYCAGGCLRNAIQTSSTDAPLCPNCSRPMSEYQKLRVTENYRLIAVLPAECAQNPRSVDCIYRPILPIHTTVI